MDRWTGPAETARVDGPTQARLIIQGEELRALYAMAACERVYRDPRTREIVTRRARSRRQSE